ncbi:hypothetical protein L798_04115 [Zootermopsis nevadensis]|uniref:Uncharacterized protein n=1 Tax=Zootermopsis nevadensis TaxID=136037 RepID=A0A067RKC3_ZOONE|nr:hypothetical protein L798_04115 [Zootermopsis nevadensis]
MSELDMNLAFNFKVNANSTELHNTILLSTGTGTVILLMLTYIIWIFIEILRSNSNAPSNTGIKQNSITESTSSIYFIRAQEPLAQYHVSDETNKIHAEETATSPPVITHI